MSEDPLLKQITRGHRVDQTDRDGNAAFNIFPNLPQPVVNPRDRNDLLRIVKISWIEGILHSLQQQTQVFPLEKELLADVVERPQYLKLATHLQQSGSVPSNLKIIDIFEERGRALLILGQPGAGKTLAMLELARDALADAESDAYQPIPVIFNLASWANPKQSIADWLISELRTRYATPTKIGRPLVEKNGLLVILDGLDEVKSEELRQQCIVAINLFHAEHKGGIVVSCRSDEYKVLMDQYKTRLQLGGAILLHSLTPLQIDQELALAGVKLSGLRAATQKDTDLLTLAETPLMFSILCLTYQDISEEDMDIEPLSSSTRGRKHLFDNYVDRMFRERLFRTLDYNGLDVFEADTTVASKDRPYSPQQTKKWLSWLAREMSRRGQYTFFIEQMQKDLLPSWKLRWLYFFGLGLIACLCVGLAFLLADVFIDLNAGIVLGSVVGLTCIYKGVQKIKTVDELYWELRQSPDQKIFFEKFWRKVYSSFIRGFFFLNFLYYCLLIPIYFLVVLLHGSGIQSSIKLAVIGAIGISPIVVPCLMFTALRGRHVHTTTRPNQGIRRSAKNAALLGGIILLMLVPAIALSWWQSNVVTGADALIGFVAPLALIAALIFGGFACIQHYTILLLLSHNHYISWKIASFLDYATEHVFLRKVGGGYIFINRPIQAYFAELKPE